MLLDTTAAKPAPKVASRTASILVLYGMTGFSGLIAEQVLEKYVTLLVGATASASAAIIFTYFLGFAMGGLAAAGLLKRGLVRNPLRAYAGIELLTGCALLGIFFRISHCHDVAGAAAKSRERGFRQIPGPILVRMHLGIADCRSNGRTITFPLLAQALDDDDSSTARRWSVAYSANLAGAVLASLTAPFVILPAIGLRGAMWLCLVICSAVAIFVQIRGRAAFADAAIPRGKQQNMAASLFTFADRSFFLWMCLFRVGNHLGAPGGNGGRRKYLRLFVVMLTGVLLGLWGGSWIANRPKGIRPSRVLLASAFALVISAGSMARWRRCCSCSRLTRSRRDFIRASCIVCWWRVF